MNAQKISDRDLVTSATLLKTDILGVVDTSEGADGSKKATLEEVVKAGMPDIVPVQGLLLEDTSAMVLPAGVIGLNSQGEFVRHDGVLDGGVYVGTTGGNVIYTPSPYKIFGSVGAEGFEGIPDASGLLYKYLKTVKLTALQSVIGTRIVMKISYVASWSASELAMIGFMLTNDITPDLATNGIYVVGSTVMSTYNACMMDIFVDGVVVDDGGDLKIEFTVFGNNLKTPALGGAKENTGDYGVSGYIIGGDFDAENELHFYLFSTSETSIAVLGADIEIKTEPV